jgi:hypothetical protein
MVLTMMIVTEGQDRMISIAASHSESHALFSAQKPVVLIYIYGFIQFFQQKVEVVPSLN